MTIAANFPGDITVEGRVYCNGVSPNTSSPSATITDSMVASNANIAATKVQQQIRHNRSLANHGATPAAVRQVIARVRGTTGSITRFEAGVVQPLTVGSLTVDLYKNGTTVLSAPVTLNTGAGTGGTAYDTVAGAISAATLAQNDVLEVVAAVTGPTGGGGLFCQLTTREDAQ